jgi:hypothetical protein
MLIKADNTKTDLEKVGSEDVDYINWLRVGTNSGLCGTNIMVL